MEGRIVHILLDWLQQRKVTFRSKTPLRPPFLFVAKVLLRSRTQSGYAAGNCSDISACANLLAESACAPPLKKHRRKSRKFWAAHTRSWAKAGRIAAGALCAAALSRT